jgi:hypothetical protein
MKYLLGKTANISLQSNPGEPQVTVFIAAKNTDPRIYLSVPDVCIVAYVEVVQPQILPDGEELLG